MDNGNTFDGYKITRFGIAHGSVGLVHEAVSTDGRRVAIKVLDRSAIEETVARDSETQTELTRRAYETNVEKFKEEYQILVGLKHPNVAEVFKIGFFENQLYIVSEFIEGKPIAEFMRGWEPVKMVPLFIQVLEGLNFIHKNGLIHLDIKSHNVLVSEIKGKLVAKIIDFGMAMAPSEYKGTFMGTPSYIAPEVALGKRELTDLRADLFSFGVLMYYSITWGSHPFARAKSSIEKTRMDIERRLTPDPPSRSHSKETANVPQYLDTIAMRLLEHEPKDRFYGSARAVINALATHAPDTFFESPETKGSYLRPMGDKHIGNESEQTKVYAAIDALASGEMPSPAAIAISGEQGTGKSHLLKKIREHAEKYADKLAIKKIELPADEVALKRFSDDITLWASENKIPAVILVDGMGTFPFLAGLFRMITQRQSNPALYSGQQPLLVAFTSSLSTPSPLVTADGGIAPKALMGEGWGEGKHYLTIPLSPFTPAELKNYLAATPAFKDKHIPDEWVAKLHKSTDGIQAEVDAHLRELDSDGLIFGLDDEILVSTLKDHEKPPATTEARLQKTYDGLLPEERRILDFLSVWSLKQITPPPNFETISHLILSPFITMYLNNLIDNAILKRTATYALTHSRTYALIFTNPYFSTLIYNQLDEKTKIRLHDSIARDLQNQLAHSRTRALKDSLLLHQGFGSNKTLAIKSLVRLAKTLLYDKGRADLALRLTQHAISIVEPQKLKLKIYLDCLLAEALFYDSKTERAEQMLKIDPVKLKPRPLMLLVRSWQALILMRMGKNEDASSAIEEALKNCEDMKHTVLYLNLLNIKALNFYRQSLKTMEQKSSLLAKAADVYQMIEKLEISIPSENARRVNTQQGLVLREQGKLREAAIAFEKNLSQKGQNVFSKISTTLALAETHRMMGEFQKAEKLAMLTLALARTSGSGEWLMYAHSLLANIYHDSDRFDDAIKEDNSYLAASGCLQEKQRHLETSTRLWLRMGHCYKEKNDHALAALHFDAVIEAGAQGFNLMSAYFGLGETCFRKKDIAGASKYFSKAETLLAQIPDDAVVSKYRERLNEMKKNCHCGGPV